MVQNRFNHVNLSDSASKEVDPACQQLIIDHHKWMGTFSPGNPLPCIFSNILHQIPESCDLSDTTFPEKKQRIFNGQLQRKHFCWTHHAQCVDDQESEVDFSGLPCPDHSKANRKRKREEGPTGPVTWLIITECETNLIDISIQKQNDEIIDMVGGNKAY